MERILERGVESFVEAEEYLRFLRASAYVEKVLFELEKVLEDT